jgi:ribonuclease R
LPKKRKDPRHAEEAERYARPIASREFILETLEARGVPMTHSELASEFDLTDEEGREALRRRLKAMARDGQIIDNRRGAWGLVQRMGLVRGIVEANREGYGFLVPESGGDDLYLHARQMRKVFNGDEVLARVVGADRRGRAEAQIVEVLKRNTVQVVGRLRVERGVRRVLPENPRVLHEVHVAKKDAGGAADGQYVTVEILKQPSGDQSPIGRVVEVLGDHLAPGMEIEVALRNYGIPFRWPEAVESEAGELPDEPAKGDFAGRFDLRDKPFVTIDGEDAKDFDDAVCCQPTRSGGYKLWVAIADVSHYVEPGSALDEEAARRGNSVYFPGRVVPMLPEALSNGLCSLKPQVNRLAMVCEMAISASGEIRRYQFFEAVIRSHMRLTYSRVAGFLAAPDSAQELGIPASLRKPLLQLHGLFEVLRDARERRGAIDFDTTETQILFGPERKIERVEPVERNDAHRLIEECMLAANVATARFLERHKLTALYRVHDGPGTQKLAGLRGFLGELGLALGGGDKPMPEDFQRLLGSVADRPDAHVIQSVMLRSLKQARYQADNIGHFGLNYPAYTHFTSPIRRYPDLLIHRAIRSVIRSKADSKQVARAKGMKTIPAARAWPYEAHDVHAIGEHCSMTERRADEAVRDVVNWLKCEYLEERVGERFDGVISGVTGFGLFVELDEVYADGLVHVSALQNDYYQFDAGRHRLIGERSRRVYGLGDRVRVQIVRVDLDERKIDLVLDEPPPRARRRGRRR